MFYPLTFGPIFKERLWGGQRLSTIFGKKIPAQSPIGESWEISDRPGDISVVDSGSLAGVDLHSLTIGGAKEVLGRELPDSGRFPLLVKILDAADTLSLQVHPPPEVAVALKGEPKTEMWYVVSADPGAELHVGLRKGVTAREFQERLRSGSVAECFHRIPVKPGDAMFVPSGRVHGIGKGCLIFEIQQNSDTTYRVFDWNRVGADGRPRDLHIGSSLRSIDFADFEPTLISSSFQGMVGNQVRPLVSCPFFDVEVRRLSRADVLATGGVAQIICPVYGRIEVVWKNESKVLEGGRFCLLPACLDEVKIAADVESEFLIAKVK